MARNAAVSSGLAQALCWWDVMPLLELRCLAGYMAPYDNGGYIKTVIEGERETQTDIHTVNQQAIGAATRDMAKTWFYAYIYGAGHQKLGEILGGNTVLGKTSKERFEKNLPALGKLYHFQKILIDL